MAEDTGRGGGCHRQSVPVVNAETLLPPQHGRQRGSCCKSQRDETRKRRPRQEARGSEEGGAVPAAAPPRRSCSFRHAAQNRDANIVFLCHEVTWGPIIEVASDQNERETETETDIGGGREEPMRSPGTTCKDHQTRLAMVLAGQQWCRSVPQSHDLSFISPPKHQRCNRNEIQVDDFSFLIP